MKFWDLMFGCSDALMFEIMSLIAFFIENTSSAALIYLNLPILISLHYHVLRH